MRLAQHRRRRDRLLLDGRENRPLPGFLQLLQLERHRLFGPRCLFGPRLRDCPWDMAGMGAALEQLQPVRRRLAREVRRRSSHFHERELEGQARVAALAEVLDRDGEQVAESQHRRLRELVRLLAQSVARLLGDGQRLRNLAHVLDEEQMAQVLEQIRDETAEILALLRELLDECKGPGRVPVDDQVAQAEQRLLLDRAQELEHGLHGDLFLRRRRQLVERRLGIAVSPASAPRNQRESGVRRLDLLSVGDPAQLLDELRQPRPREDERLAARPDRRQHLREVGGAEDEDEVGRRLLDQLQQRVEGGVRELVRLVEDVDLVAPLDRLQDDALADLADVVDPALRGRVHLDDVERRSVRDRAAGVAFVVGGRRRALRAVQRLREDARERRLARASGAGEQVRLADLPVRDRVRQRPHDRLLTYYLAEVLRAVLPVERGHGTTLTIHGPDAPSA